MIESYVVVNHLVRETEKLDAARVTTQRTSAVLKGSRTALVAVATAGRFDAAIGLSARGCS